MWLHHEPKVGTFKKYYKCNYFLCYLFDWKISSTQNSYTYSVNRDEFES